MKQAVLKSFDMTWLPLTGLLIFVVMFALYALWALRRSNQGMFEHVAGLPLSEAPAQKRNSHE